ncbi:hypothetical protein ASF73_12955 [Xanthomonas sp. Leaf131]|nr:hypothetical protein ASF73_12955 [Xanthomonas sp. Leaf131]
MKNYGPAFLSAVVYLISLFLPALHGGGKQIVGLVLLLLGWLQTADAQCFAWLANPLYLAAWGALLFKRFALSCSIALVACVVGLDTFRATVFSPDERGEDVLIDKVGIAFYVWELSFIIIVVASLLRWHSARKLKSESVGNGVGSAN